MNRFVIIACFFCGIVYSGCKKSTPTAGQLTLSQYTITLSPDGGTVKIIINSSTAWAIDSVSGAWIKFSKYQGNSGTDSVVVTAAANATGGDLAASFAVTGSGMSSLVNVSQSYPIFPSYNTSPIAADPSGMSSTAVQISANMKLGWNLGNSLEAPGGETGWGNPVITQALIDLVKQSGFNAIRLPCAWDQHANQATGAIDTAWLARVKQVVQYCINDGMYVLLNSHYDDGWLDCTATGARLDTVRAKQKAYWEQIATYMRDFDEHLMLASANEPNATDLATSTVLLSYHQIFINAVRSTGGKNAYRTLVIQSPSTSIDMSDYFAGIPGMPGDQLPGKLMLEVHYYSPSNFCLLTANASWGNEWCYWGANYHSSDDPTRNATGSEEPYMDSELSYVQKTFVDKGIPVLVGEFDVVRHNATLTGMPQDSILSLNSRAHFFSYLTQSARTKGIPVFMWDAYYDVIDRVHNVVYDPQALDSLRTGAGL
jgi:aryl-phospho-beta-D-glucosidase BglC (GH1 family)